jgi:hypothetical protein
MPHDPPISASLSFDGKSHRLYFGVKSVSDLLLFTACTHFSPVSAAELLTAMDVLW